MNGATRTSDPGTSEEPSTSTGIPLVTVSPRLRPLEKKGLFVCKWPQRDRMGGTMSLNWMMTYSGVVYRPFEPNSKDVRLDDIAHALSMICRYGGHTRWFYSVAEHSVHVSHMVPPDLALEALLHDAAEAYVGDMIIPLKWSGKLDEFKRIEKLNDLAIRIRFVLPHEESPEVKKADTDIRETEWTTLMQPIPPEMVWKWPGVLDPSAHLKLWCPEVAEQKFLRRYRELCKEGL